LPLRRRNGRRITEEIEREAIRRALLHADGNRIRAARALGIHRSTLRRKMEEFGLRS
jgi:DNA-binding NtrC family response regulator